VLIDAEHLTLRLVEPEYLLDAIVFSGGPALVRGVE